MAPWTKLVWTDEEKATLAEMWNSGDSSRIIGERLNKTRNSILGMANRLGLPKHRSLTRRDLLEGPRRPVRKPPPERLRTYHASAPRLGIAIPETESGVAFVDMKNNLCHAIIGRDSRGFKLVRFCGLPVKNDSSFCPGHSAIFFVPRY